MRVWIVFAALVVFTGAGCKPSEQGTNGAAPQTQLKPESSDDKIVSAVKAKFAADDELKKETISVEVKDGRVTLSGTVSNDGVRAKADELTREVPDVFGVDAEKLTTK